MEENQEEEFFIKTKKFRNKTTGEIVTQFSILDIANFEEIEDENN